MSTSKPQLPKIPQRLLRLLCPEHLSESIEGDLLEIFEDDLTLMDVSKAKRRYTWQVIRFIHPSIILRNKFNTSIMNYGLVKNHAKISMRNLVKGKIYSVINIAGLALGMAACLLILCFTNFEKSYDNFFTDLDQLYRVNQTAIWDKDGGIMSSSAPPLGSVLQEQYPEIISSMRINTPGNALVRYLDTKGIVHTHNENNILAVDSNFFDFFQLPLKEGTHIDALKGIGKVVITEEMALKYFGQEPAVGKILEYSENRRPLQVTAVTNTLPKNMHLNFDFLISMPTNGNVKEFDWSWIWTQMVTYIKLQPGTNPETLVPRLQDLPEQHIKASFGRLGMDFDDFVSDKGGWKFYLQPVRSIHLGSHNISNRIARTIDGTIINTLQVLAFLILVIAMINFVNLSTARSSTRNKEIGVKKTMGASVGSLISQFLIESIMISFVAVLIAFPLLTGLKQLVLNFTHIDIPVQSIFQYETIIYIIISTVFIGLLAGIYPSLYLSRFKISRVFKNNSGQSGSASRLRNALVIVQFAVSMALIAGTALIMKQLDYMQNKDLGFTKDHVLIINNAEKLGNQIESFRNEIAGLSDITQAAISMAVPGRGSWEDIFMREGSNIKLPIGQIKIDDQFFSTLEFKLKAGRLFDRDRPADNHAVIINETTARLFGWTVEESLGKKIIYPGYPEDIRVLGVVDDFHFQSLRQEINPLMFFNLRSAMWGDMRVVSVKYGDVDPTVLLSQLKTSWDQYANEIPFDYSFYDDELALMYEDEVQVGNLIGIFGGFTLFIAIIGLIGMVTYSVEKRKKEIGIRKVMGATPFEIFMMFNKQYAILGLIALVISIPISWSTLDQWLQGFAFRVSLNPTIFILSGIIVMVIAGLSVAYLSLSAASLRPSEVLKDE